MARVSSGETVIITVGMPRASISRCTTPITRWHAGQPPVSTTASVCERSISLAMARGGGGGAHPLVLRFQVGRETLATDVLVGNALDEAFRRQLAQPRER